jgi:phosphohistidine phosphatase
MNLIVIRHGQAGNPSDFALRGLSDDLRPLTLKGRRRMRQNARGLAGLVETIDLVAHSPLVRAVETASIVAGAFKAPLVELADLAPQGSRQQLLDWLAAQPLTASVAIVGHEPTLSQLVAWLTTGHEQAYFEFRKGAAARVLLRNQVAPGAGELCWLMTPRQLRRCRRRR